MGFQYVEYDLLETDIRESIATELKHHQIEEKDLKKALNILHLTHPERAKQCKYLLAVINNLSQLETKTKTVVLNAATFYVRDQIAESYKGIFSLLLAPERSVLFNLLTISLNLSKENFPDSKDLLNMYDALSCFMYQHVYKNSDPSSGYLEKKLQIFSKRKIDGYDVEKMLTDLLDKTTTLQVQQINRMKKEQLMPKVFDSKYEVKLFRGITAKVSMVAPITDSEEQTKYTYCNS